MKIRLLSLASAVVMLLTLAVGCAGIGTSDPSGGKTPANDNKAQLVVAMNPIFVYDEGDTVIPYNDIKNATKADFENATLTTLQQTTDWRWSYRLGDAWKDRAIYALDNWTNGAGVEAKNAFSYTYSGDGTMSLASYYAQSTELTTYNTADAVSDYGLLLSVTGGEEEALTYTVQKDGTLNVAEGFVTAIQSVSGVKTGFLAEDGTARSASFRILANNVQVFSGTLCNSTASPDGKAVTSLQYEQISDMAVKAGDILAFCVKLEAIANTDEDQSAPPYNEEDNWTTVNTEVKVPITGNENTGNADTNITEGEALPLLDDLEFRFVLVRDISAMEMEMNLLAGQFREDLERIFEAEVIARNEGHDEKTYEIVIGPMENRPESVKIYNELKNGRVNNANDYIVRRVGTKVYISALNTDTLTAAFNHFIKTFCSDNESPIPANYDYTYRAQTVAATIAGNPIGNYVFRVEKYATTMAYFGAEEIRSWVRENCGYLLPIIPMTDDGKRYEYEIVVGPLNGSVKLERAYDTRFTVDTTETVGKFKVDDDGYNGDVRTYDVKLTGKKLLISGGSSYAVNAAAQQVCLAMDKNKGALPKDFAVSGTYAVGDYSLTSGYDMVWKEDFSYTGTHEEVDKEVREYWGITTDTSRGPTLLGKDEYGDDVWDQQRRPGIYGENWWIWQDNTNNGYLVEVTKKESYGYDAGRVVSQGKWSFRYGIWETRLVVGTRNGSCSAVWSETMSPDPNPVRNEFDLYENFGMDIIDACYFQWADEQHGGNIGYTYSPGPNGHTVYPTEGEHFYDTFHSIAIEWTPDRVTFYWDGVEYDNFDEPDAPCRQSSTIIRFACGVGTGTYAPGHGGKDPHDWMDEAYTALTGKTVEDFFEVQVVDYSYIFQTSNEGKNAVQKNKFTYVRMHPNNPYYTGFLKKSDDFKSAQMP